MCGTGECVPTQEICDDKVSCLDNGDVRYCQVLRGEEEGWFDTYEYKYCLPITL